jgi:hypothetical protein
MSSAKPTPDAPDGFLSRWSRRKVQARDGQAQTEPPSPSSTAPPALPAGWRERRRRSYGGSSVVLLELAGPEAGNSDPRC